MSSEEEVLENDPAVRGAMAIAEQAGISRVVSGQDGVLDSTLGALRGWTHHPQSGEG